MVPNTEQFIATLILPKCAKRSNISGNNNVCFIFNEFQSFKQYFNKNNNLLDVSLKLVLLNFFLMP